MWFSYRHFVMESVPDPLTKYLGLILQLPLIWHNINGIKSMIECILAYTLTNLSQLKMEWQAKWKFGYYINSMGKSASQETMQTNL